MNKAKPRSGKGGRPQWQVLADYRSYRKQRAKRVRKKREANK